VQVDLPVMSVGAPAMGGESVSEDEEPVTCPNWKDVGLSGSFAIQLQSLESGEYLPL
jgi:hypothetical protein